MVAIRSLARVVAPSGLAVAALMALGGCESRSDRAPVVYRGSAPGVAASSRAASPVVAAPAPAVEVAALPPAGAAPAPAPDGVIDYGGYRAVVARPGDTVASLAARAGVPASALAAYNGLPVGHTPRPGDELIVPSEADVGVAAAPEPAPPAVERAAPPAPRSSGFDLARIEAAIEEPPQPAAAAPAPEPAPAPAATAAPTPAETEVALAEPPESGVAAVEIAPDVEPAPAEPEPAPPAIAAPPPAAATAVFVKPVDGPITRPYRRGGDAPNDGVDFAAPAGAPVRAAADGQVALVSESLGGLGTIVLIRHGDDLLTVYGRVDGVTVARGDTVSQGDVIGTVAPAGDRDPALHFEVRRGAESVDPADFL